MKLQISLKYFIPQFVGALMNCYYAPSFLKEHQLWKGFGKHKLVTLILLILGALLSWQMISAALFVINPSDPVVSSMSIGSRLSEVATGILGDFGEQMFSGSYKYLFLICMELFIFHLVIRANEIINNESEKLTSKLFIRAQIRMFKVMLLVFVLKTIFEFIASLGLGIVNLDILENPVSIIIESFFLGFAIIDNYYELVKLGIRESLHRTQQFFGIAVGIGLVLFIFMHIPVIGPFAGTIIASIAVAKSMNKWDPVEDFHPEKAFV